MRSLKAGIGTQDSTDLNEEYDLFNLSSYADANINLENELRYFVHAENTEFGELPQDFKNVWMVYLLILQIMIKLLHNLISHQSFLRI